MTTSKSSGCGLVLGLALVVAGTLFLGANLFGYSMLSVWSRALSVFGRFWPLILVVWGSVKIYQRMARPEESRVTAGEVFLLILLMIAGLSIRTVQKLAADEDFFEGWFLPGPDFGPAERFTEDERFSLKDGQALRIDNDRGTVTIQGWDEEDLKVSLTKRVYRRSESEARRIAETITLKLEPGTDAEPARLVTARPDGHSRDRVETDLQVWVPRTVAVTLSNGRGAVRVSGMHAAVGVASAYDVIEVEDVDGQVRVDGRHGPVRISNVRGDVEARNRYDTLKVEGVHGDVVAESANGELDVEDVSGKARLENRYSRVRAAQVQGDLTVVAANTEVSVEDAGRSVSIETSFQPIFVKGVAGRLTIDGRNAEIEVHDVKGDVDLTNKYRPVSVTQVSGAVVMDVEQCEVHAQGVSGPLRINGSYQPIDVSGFRSSVSVTTEHAPVTLTASALTGEVKVATTYGTIRLAVPPSSSFRLVAKTEGGRVRSELDDATWKRQTSGENEEVQGTVGGGAVPVTLETKFGSVEIVEAAGAEAEEAPEAPRAPKAPKPPKPPKAPPAPSGEEEPRK